MWIERFSAIDSWHDLNLAYSLRTNTWYWNIRKNSLEELEMGFSQLIHLRHFEQQQTTHKCNTMKRKMGIPNTFDPIKKIWADGLRLSVWYNWNPVDLKSLFRNYFNFNTHSVISIGHQNDRSFVCSQFQLILSTFDIFYFRVKKTL